jgi:hypothetical protein
VVSCRESHGDARRLGLHVKLKKVDEDAVIEAWGKRLKNMKPGFDAFRESRDDGNDDLWPYLEKLVDRAMKANP